jgi:NAD(P)-dependent dehydrogenase (short-subunit alcohol dehydrogenase family)
MMRDWQGRMVMVTGGASGIGAATCQALTRQGARVVIVDHNRAMAEALEAALPKGRSLAIPADVTEPAALKQAVAVAIQRFGGLHGAVNAAGIGASRHDLTDIPADDWHRVLAVNLTGVFNALQAQIPAILASGGGAIVNISSICGLVAVAGSAAYTASKHGVIGLTKAAALDYAGRGLRINAIAPGYVDTPLVATRPQPIRESLASKHPMGRLSTAMEIAEVALFLLSPSSSFVTGSVVSADGGLTAQ